MAPADDPRSVLVTGASTGIGAACALGLSADGWRVFAGVRRDADGARLQAAAEGELIPVRLDVTDEAQVTAAFERIEGVLGDAPLHGLVNNAGIAVGAPMEFVPLADLRRQLEINVVGLVAVTQAALPLLRRAASGQARIINMGSSSGEFTAPFLGPYAASKHAVEAVSDALRRELAEWRIGVSLVQPGAIQTPIWEKSTKEADRMAEQLPAHAQELYATQIETIREAALKTAAEAIPATRVYEKVRHALTARWPRTRYAVGFDSKLQVFLRHQIPDRWVDQLVWRFMRL